MTQLNAKFQEFALQVSYICNLETGGKISPQQAHSQLEVLLADLDGFIAQHVFKP
jgi:hypothetical protein